LRASRGEQLLAPRLDLRERQLPWAPFSIPSNPSLRNRPTSRLRHSGRGGACSKAASTSFGPLNPRVATAASPAAAKRDGGNAGTRVGPGGRLRRANAVAANKRDATGCGFPHPCPANHRSSRLSPRRSPPQLHPLPSRARASARRQSPRIFRTGRVSGPVATSCSRSPRRCRPSDSVPATAVERYATCSTARRVIVGVAVRGIDRHVGDRVRGRRDVFRGCAHVLASPGSHVPPKTEKATGGFRFTGPPVPSR
jgi:hypothetical protein